MDLLNSLSEAIQLQQHKKDDDFKESMSKPLNERIAKGHTLINLKITSMEVSKNADFCPSLSGSLRYVDKVYVHCPNNCSKFREGSPVILSNGKYKLNMEIEADGIDDFVLRANSFAMSTNIIDTSEDVSDSNWELNPVNVTITQRLLQASLQRLKDKPEALRRMEKLLEGSLINRQESSSYAPTDNLSQNLAIQRALGCSDFCIIQGPPGTGKTFTIGKIAARLIQEGKKVFVTGPTHTAINNCLNTISNEVRDPSKIVKLGEKYQAAEILGNEYITRKGRLRISDYINNPSFCQNGFAIGATPYALCYPVSKKMEGWYFNVIIMDEAAQLSMPLALAAMTSGDKLVFVGDHMQLDPIIPKNTGNRLFECSVFKKMVDLYPHQIILLDQSYRLNKELIRIPNQLFYSGKLSSKCEMDKEFKGFHCSHYPEIINDDSCEVLFVHHEFDSLGRSPYEAKVVAGIVADLRENNVDFSNIGIMSPYRAQIREIKRALSDNGIITEDPIDNLFIDTVERMQGQEKDYILYSMSNSNPEEVEDRLEFFYSPNRLNVAITRAHVKCIVIANEKVFDICKKRIGLPQTSLDLRKGMQTFLDYSDLSYKIEASCGEDKDEW